MERIWKSPGRAGGRRSHDANSLAAQPATCTKTRKGKQGGWAGPHSDYELFMGLTNREYRKVDRLLEERRFPQDATIFRMGDPSDCLYALRKGMVKLVFHPATGAGMIITILRRRDTFGELFLVDNGRPFDAVAMTDVIAVVLSREHFMGLLASVPRIRMNIIRVLSNRLARSEKRVADFNHNDSGRRLAKILLQMCDEDGEEIPAGVLLPLSLKHKDLADMIGTTRETVTIGLNRFYRLGLLSIQGGRFVVNRGGLVSFLSPGDYRASVEWHPQGKTA